MAKYDLPPIVYGIETEYTASVRLPDDDFDGFVGACHRDTEIDITPDASSDDKSLNEAIEGMEWMTAFEAAKVNIDDVGMLSNGGRGYVDNDAPEYCTPETSTAEEVVHRKFAGDRLMYNVFANLRVANVIVSAQLNNRSVDHHGNARGTHLNTPVSLNLRKKEGNSSGHLTDINMLAILNVAKGAICGAGGLLVDPHTGKTNFHYSPRLSVTDRLSASGSFGTCKPLVRTYLNEDIGCARLETPTNDALNFAWPLRASLVLTQAAGRLLSAGFDVFRPTFLPSPVYAAQTVGRQGPNCRITLWHQDGPHSYRPTDLLIKFASEVLRIDEKAGILDDEMRQVLGEVIEVCDKLHTDPDSVDRIVESVARKKFLDSRRGDRVDYGGEELCRLDYYWDLIGGGIAEKLREAGKVGWYGFNTMYSVRHQQKMMTVPPQDTRAKLRGEVMTGIISGTIEDWNEIELEDGTAFELPPRATALLPIYLQLPQPIDL